jgi:hypothetical protein
MDFSITPGTIADSPAKRAMLGNAAQAMAADIEQAIATGQLSAAEVSQLHGVLAGLTGDAELAQAYVGLVAAGGDAISANVESGKVSANVDESGGSGYNERKGIDEIETVLNRKTSNTGAFRGLAEAMQYRNVERVAKRAGIGLQGIMVKIVRDENLIGTGYYGWTSPDGNIIHLYPDAFTNTESLVKTLGHERVHAYQVKTFGAPDLQTIRGYEDGADESEMVWWDYYNKNNG